MLLRRSYSENFYFFTDYINEKIRKNVLNFNKIAIVYNQVSIIDLKRFLIIKNFCKSNNIKLYMLDNLRIAKKFNLDGLVLSHNNYKISYLISAKSKKNNFNIIGKAHNQREYYFKKRQNCKNIILSPVFKNKKYTDNQLLGIIKFNLLSKNWEKNVFALGGISFLNLKKLQMTKIKGFAFNTLINNPQIKKPVLFFKRERV
jgi:thiamine-phosphate pyrophosphorylase